MVYFFFLEHLSGLVWVTCMTLDRMDSTQICYCFSLQKARSNLTCFTIFPCVSLGTQAHITVLLVMCSTRSIILTRRTDARRLKRKENDLLAPNSYTKSLGRLCYKYSSTFPDIQHCTSLVSTKLSPFPITTYGYLIKHRPPQRLGTN